MKKILKDSIVDDYAEFVRPISSDQFRLKKKVSIDFEDGKEEFSLFGAEGSGAGRIKILSGEVDGQSVSAFQIDDLNIYLISWEKDSSNISVLYEKKWVSISPLLFAKFLAGVEFLKENIIDWHILKDYDNLYQHLISYLNYETGQ